jgi:hypothetical protein
MGEENYSTHSWFNGQIGERELGAPSVASASFHLGTSVFDGPMAYWNRDHNHIHRAEEHLVRTSYESRTGKVIPLYTHLPAENALTCAR